MKTLCITKNKLLAESFDKNQAFHPIDVYTELQAPQDFNQFQIILIDGECCPLNFAESSIVQYKNSQKGTTPHFFFIIPNKTETNVIRQLQFFCMSKGIYPFLPHLSPEQISRSIMAQLQAEREKPMSNIICFLGTHPGVGVTTLALETAARISARSKASIGLLSLNSTNPGDTFVDKYDGVYLDEIKSALNNHMITGEQLYQSMASINQFKYLAGNRDIKNRLYYTADEIKYLIDTAKTKFDILIIDGGCQYDNALTIQALLASEIKILVSSQSHTGFNCWQRAYEQIIEPLGFSEKNFLLLINKYKDGLHFLRTKSLQDMYKISSLGEVPDIGDFGIMAEEDRCLPSRYQVTEYNQALHKLSSNLIKLYNIPAQPDQKENKGLLNKFFVRYKGAAHV